MSEVPLINRYLIAAFALFLGFFAAQTDSATSQESDIIENAGMGYVYMDYGRDAGDEGLLSAYRTPSTRPTVVRYLEERIGDVAITEALIAAADRHGLDPALVVAISWQESRFRTRATGVNRNGSTDRGLMQLNSSTFKHLSIEDFYEPYINANLGAEYLRKTMDLSGNTVAALAMYNAGPNRVGTLGAPRTTLDYISKIMTYKDDLVEGYQNEYGSGSVLMARDNKPVKNPDLL